VQSAQTGEAEVAEHVLGDQRWAQQQHDVCSDDRRPQCGPRYCARGKQHRQVARAHDQRERLEAIGSDADAEAFEWTRQPARPAAAASGDIKRGLRRCAGCDQEDGREYAKQADCAKCAQGPH
jgi:hypothetical protein